MANKFKAPVLDNLEFVKGTPTKVEPGSPFVLEFWATWCGPCVKTIPHLSELQKKYPNVTFIGISAGEDESTVRQFVDKMGSQMDYRVALDEDMSAYELMHKFNVRGIPHAFVIDKEGNIVHHDHPLQPNFENHIRDVNQSAQKQEALPLIKESKEELNNMKVRELKNILKERGIDSSVCIEKSDLVDLIYDRCRNTVFYKRG